MRHSSLFAWTLAAALAAAAPCARAQDSADLVFWQSIQASKNPAEFQLYLQTYPNGRFAGLARMRMDELTKGAAPGLAPTPTAGPAVPPAPPVLDDLPAPTLTMTPPAGRVGQRFTVACVNFPDLTNAGYDKLVIVPAGSPVMSPLSDPQQSKVIWSDYARNCGLQAVQAGPFAPGAYEIRWMTTLYNNEPTTRYDMKAMTAFTVR